MMINAYNESYIDDAACNLGTLFDYLINYVDFDPDDAFEMFANSSIGIHFENGNPSYIAGRSGVELAYMLLEEVKKCDSLPQYDCPVDKSRQYWAGWSIAYFQWNRAMRFRDIIKSGITASKVIGMYILHEADINKFIDACDLIIEEYNKNELSALKRFREYHNLTQKELSVKSGVSLRMIQLYEQKQNDLSKAQVKVVYNLAKVLDCSIEDLIL